MASGRPGFLAFDPSHAGVAGATGATSGGGGSLGAGTFYSEPTVMTAQGWSDVTDVVETYGSLAGTMTAEVSNATDADVLAGTDVWVVDTSISIAAIAGSVTTLVMDTAALNWIPAVSGSTFTVAVATTGRLPAVTASGAGVGKTLTASAVGALTIDGIAPILNAIILVKNQDNPVDNGVYVLSTLGTAGVAFILTRSTSLDATAEAIPGITAVVTAGTVNTGLHFALTGPAATTLVKAPRFGFARYRLKFVQSGGLGAIKDLRCVKAS